MDNKSQEKISQVKDALTKIQELDVESLSEEDLESVSGGLCSIWCCSSSAASDDSFKPE